MNKTLKCAISRFFGLTVGLCMAVTPLAAENTPTYSEPVLLKRSEAVFSNPTDLAISPEGGYLLVADTGNNEIKIMQPGTLKILSQFGKEDLEAPRNLYFAKNGNLLVIDRNNTRQVSYTFKGVFRDGSANVKKLGEKSAEADQTSRPELAKDSTGQFYRAAPDANQIEIFDKKNKRIGLYGAGELSSPSAVETVGRYFWIADTGNNRILLLKAPRSQGP